VNVTRGIQSALNPQSVDAEAVATFSWVLIWGGLVVAIVVFAFAAFALWGPRERRGALGSNKFVIYGGILFPGVVLVTLFVYSLTLAGGVVTARQPPSVRIEVVGHQWWWRVYYLDAEGRVEFETANEVRIPAERPVELVLKSDDVIHSFWVPNLAGKLDMIPGHVNRLRVTAAREGTFRGQCAEYCGGPHALMAFYVIAQSGEEFERWREIQRATAAEPEDEASALGRKLFLGRCAVCHTVRGTAAEGRLGPDLTHVASRTHLAAGILQNNRANIAAWVSASQRIKPGNLMPSMNVFSGDELRALTAYLANLE
jgi:cytochrome c oxidase subunit II